MVTSRRGAAAGVLLQTLAILVIAGGLAYADSRLRPVKTAIAIPAPAPTSDQPRTTPGTAPGTAPGKAPGTPAITPGGTPGTRPDTTPGTAPGATPAAPDASPAETVVNPPAATPDGKAPGVLPTDIASGAHITIGQAKAFWDTGTPFLDARTDEEFAGGHIQTAVHLTAQDVQEGRAAKLQYYDPSQPIVIYCTGGSCHASENLAILLSNFAGFQKIYIMEAGFDAWKDAGYPIEQ